MSSDLSVLPFEPRTCTNEDSLEVFVDQQYHNPDFKASNALIVCCAFGAFAAVAAPFAGFLASGMKRAYQIKDFANTLPGHGGFTDRFDCTIFADIFMLGMLVHILYKQYIVMDKVEAGFTELSTSQQ